MFDRFLIAQEGVYPQALAELRAGQKRSHWMWFIFPQIAGLGQSATSRRFALSSLAEAREFSDHLVLGERLRRCTSAVLEASARPEGPDVSAIFGAPDDLKFHSSMTLFSRAAPHEAVFRRALVTLFAGVEDIETIKRI
ncbi:DUF1810 domain-containing protein [uncultured Devosia sp.]|uniref:DUF1810 domain-containing protein n=1 Tax=uncultured Devosia sp. TaxID=211434 RepID=UPI0035CBF45B